MSILVQLYGVPTYISACPAWFYPRILVGAGMALTVPFAHKHNITHVVNCASDQDSPFWFKMKHPDKYACLNAVDSLRVNILEWYPVFEAWMHEFLREGTGTVYVHCQAGMNRSGSLALAYVCKNFGLDFTTVVQSTRMQRPILFQNRVFMDQVKQFINGCVSGAKDSGDEQRSDDRDIGFRASGDYTNIKRLDESPTEPAGGVGDPAEGSLRPLCS